jgi:hypothetical protein
MRTITSRNVRAYIMALHAYQAAIDVDWAVRAPLRTAMRLAYAKLTGGQLAEAQRLLAEDHADTP